MTDELDKPNKEHAKYAGLETKRNVYRAVYGGTDAIRATGKANLPMYPAEDTKDYQARLDQATIDGIVLGGVETLVGSVFEADIDVSKVHASLVPYLENIDNKGNSFNIFARDAFRESFEGFSCILVDAPAGGKANDLAEQQELALRPYLSLYKAGNVINWRYGVNPATKQRELKLLVLREVSSEPAGRFGSADVTRYRVFSVEKSVVSWELWKETKDAGGKKDVVFESGGKVTNVTQIPAAFVGDIEADPKLLVESRLEIKAYQKESSFDVIEYLSIPTFYTKGYEGEDALALGASAHIKLPIDGDLGYAQIDAAGHDSLKGTVREIKQGIKARVNYLLDSAMQQPDKTATEVVVADKDKQARLVVWSDELKDALETALMFMGQMTGLGEDEAGEITLNTQWTVAEQRRIESETRRAAADEANIAATLAKAKTGVTA